ncbi:transcriptional regulator, XRE family [Desulforamulus reducens MI-1]|uniref:Transcriptional regulator, XRE family n=1 Tax=Desulforamulus reducens (strain ATCC BAA-1160 / DSM 100696 / MI-1) TaxID=349161 RepID=A4J788_DESRM|nr:helix-turn-helix transcriptional regulator [Desulforamulus reducens]ABO50941.1 transcriptional regulator, XRE family [Desulforamulus reducens MI-1]
MFAKRLIELRTREKLTQKELAAKLNLGRGALSLYEIGQREPDLQTVKNMADYFNVSADYLLGRTKVMSGNERVQLDPLYVDMIRAWENKKGTPEQMKEALEINHGYIELIKEWEKEGMSPNKVKEIWNKMLEVKSLLDSPKKK